jgi:hypothetical protein
MEGDGGDASAPSVEGGETSAPTQETNGPTTTADMPIAPVYAGAYSPYNFGVVRGRKKSFIEGCYGV